MSNTALIVLVVVVYALALWRAKRDPRFTRQMWKQGWLASARAMFWLVLGIVAMIGIAVWRANEIPAALGLALFAIALAGMVAIYTLYVVRAAPVGAPAWALRQDGALDKVLAIATGISFGSLLVI